MARQQHQRRLARLRRAQRRRRIGEARAAADPHDAALTGRRPHASAMCTAAASWRTWISRSRVPIAASNSGMMWLPESVKIVVSPAASSVRATMSAPRTSVGMLYPIAYWLAPVREQHRVVARTLDYPLYRTLGFAPTPHQRRCRRSAPSTRDFGRPVAQGRRRRKRHTFQRGRITCRWRRRQASQAHAGKLHVASVLEIGQHRRQRLLRRGHLGAEREDRQQALRVAPGQAQPRSRSARLSEARSGSLREWLELARGLGGLPLQLALVGRCRPPPAWRRWVSRSDLPLQIGDAVLGDDDVEQGAAAPWCCRSSKARSSGCAGFAAARCARR